MLRSLLALVAALVSPAWGQFTGLATPSDGSVVYFSSTLRLKGTAEPDSGKLFAADVSGVRLFRSPDTAPFTGATGGYEDFFGAETSADGRTVAVRAWLTTSGWAADLISPSAERTLAGYVHLSPGGRFAIADTTQTVFSSATLQLLDLQSGSQTAVPLPAVTGPWQATFPASGRVIADDGTAIFSFYNAAWIARPGQDTQPFPVANAVPLAIDAAAAHVLYAAGAWHLLNLATGQDQGVLADADTTDASAAGMSDDASRVLFLRGGQAYVVQTDGTGLQTVTSDPATITAAILSGNGNIVYAVTGEGRLLKIAVDTGVLVEIVGRTPFLTSALYTRAGLAAAVSGVGFGDLPPTLLIGNRQATILEATPAQIGFLVPWNIQPLGQVSTLNLVAEIAGVNSPFDFPATTIQVDSTPAAGAIAHQDWGSLVTSGSPPHVGEIIHIYAVGLGPVNPEVPDGTPAPSAEPLARLAKPMVCDNSDVLYAGLAPTEVERIYQVDLRLNLAGYRQYHCSAAGLSDFIFLTFNVLP